MEIKKTEITALLDEMGIVQAESLDSLIDTLKERCGKDLAKRIENCIYQRSEDTSSSDEDIYSLMNTWRVP